MTVIYNVFGELRKYISFKRKCVLPKKVKYIGWKVFGKTNIFNKRIKELVIPDSVLLICAYELEGLVSLEKIVFEGNTRLEGEIFGDKLKNIKEIDLGPRCAIIGNVFNGMAPEKILRCGQPLEKKQLENYVYNHGLNPINLQDSRPFVSELKLFYMAIE